MMFSSYARLLPDDNFTAVSSPPHLVADHRILSSRKLSAFLNDSMTRWHACASLKKRIKKTQCCCNAKEVATAYWNSVASSRNAYSLYYQRRAYESLSFKEIGPDFCFSRRGTYSSHSVRHRSLEWAVNTYWTQKYCFLWTYLNLTNFDLLAYCC
jgi:hypothetical protein